MKKLLLAAACLLVSAPHLAHAQRYSINVKNDSENAIWVTTYVAKDHRSSQIKAMCVPGGSSSNVASQSNDVGGWVLFELKRDKTSCAVHENVSVVEKAASSRITTGSACLVCNAYPC